MSFTIVVILLCVVQINRFIFKNDNLVTLQCILSGLPIGHHRPQPRCWSGSHSFGSVETFLPRPDMLLLLSSRMACQVSE